MAPSLLLKHNVSNDHLFDSFAPISTSSSRPYIDSRWTTRWRSRKKGGKTSRRGSNIYWRCVLNSLMSRSSARLNLSLQPTLLFSRSTGTLRLRCYQLHPVLLYDMVIPFYCFILQSHHLFLPQIPSCVPDLKHSSSIWPISSQESFVEVSEVTET